jgi:hypothetical protein
MPSPDYNPPPDFVPNTMFDTTFDANVQISNSLLALYQQGSQSWDGFFNPASVTGDHTFRIDRGIDYYYDGTRWLSIAEYGVQITPLFSTTTSGTATAVVPLPSVYAPYFTTITTAVKVDTTNNASNYWQVLVQGLNASQGSSTTLLTYFTDGYAVNTWGVNNATAVTSPAITPAPANATHLKITLTKIAGTPGQINIASHAYYRLIG